MIRNSIHHAVSLVLNDRRIAPSDPAAVLAGVLSMLGLLGAVLAVSVDRWEVAVGCLLITVLNYQIAARRTRNPSVD